jgi:SAM-dependent methyltransferase
MTSLPPNVVVHSQLPSAYSGYQVTDRAAMQALAEAEGRHFWFLSRNRFIARRLERLAVRPPARILELGCGGGAVLSHLSRSGYEVTGVDGHLERVVEAAARAPAARLVVHDLERGLSPLGDERFDAVALFDVIEHLDNPWSALGAAFEHVAPGGWLVGTVPALRMLWSDVDIRSGHRRRYGRAELRAVMTGLRGVTEVEVVPFHRLLVPLLWMQRRVAASPRALEDGLSVPTPLMNAAMLRILLLEQGLDRLLRPIPGASLWFAARRETGQTAPSWEKKASD